jgi:glycosyltransferase involved in cell wall biosynthesis
MRKNASAGSRGAVPLGIIIPVYNEAENIGRTIEAIEDKVATPHRIHIVYDFDEDNTLPAAREYLRKGVHIRFIKNPVRGVAGAIKTGLREAGEEWLLVTMADLSDDHSVVDAMCGLMRDGYDLVCGSRYMRGGKQIGGPRLKKLLSRFAGVSLRYLAGLPTHDITNSFKLYRKRMVDALLLESSGGFEIGMEIVTKAHFSHYRVTQVPCLWTDRQAGQSRFKIIKWVPKYLKWYMWAFRRRIHL